MVRSPFKGELAAQMWGGQSAVHPALGNSGLSQTQRALLPEVMPSLGELTFGD